MLQCCGAAVRPWKTGRILAHELSKVTRRPEFRDRILVQQIRKCAISIMANIAEGFDAGSHPEFARFLRISSRSGSELQSHLYIALDEGFVDTGTFDSLYKLAASVKALNGGFIRYLRSVS